MSTRDTGPLVLGMEELSGRQDVGRKAASLAELRSFGIPVPPFVVLPVSTVQDFRRAAFSPFDSDLRALSDAVRAKLPCASYAVRSCALIEDGDVSSYAGQFHTEIDVAPSGLETAIAAVVKQASDFLHRDLSRFSVMVQQYVAADVSGVAFTRHPSGDRQMLIEYHGGKGEDVVSGRVTPSRVEWFWTEAKPRLPVPEADGLLACFQNIEQLFGAPQDIEWVAEGDRWWIVQARPITTIHPALYQELVALDAELPHGKPFLYERTEACEGAPRPSRFMRSLLAALYASGGPIDRVYARHGIRYVPRDFFRLVRGWLYVDRDEEIRTLFPTHGYAASSAPGKPVRVRWDGALTSWRNMWSLARLRGDKPEFFAHKISEALARRSSSSLRVAWSAFLEDYETIFEVNLLAQQAYAAADQLLSKHPISLTRFLAAHLSRRFVGLDEASPPTGCMGNGLDIEDRTPFIMQTADGRVDEGIETWWEGLADWQRKVLEPALRRASSFGALRERGRWLTVFHVSRLRALIQVFAAGKGIPWDWIVEAEVAELMKGRVDPVELRARADERSGWRIESLPARLTNRCGGAAPQKPVGVSVGRAAGTLVARNAIASVGDPVLFVESLSPDLAPTLDRVRGIVATRGGILSHLSILARERGIPVVVNIDLRMQGIALGERVEIDGETGEVRVA